MTDQPYSLIIVGAGPAGMTSAIAAADRGAKVALIEVGDRMGGALLINRGQLSGAGTKLQAERGIVDTPKDHFEDAMRLSRGTADPRFLELAVNLQGPFIDWLMDHGFEMEADMPRIIHGNEAYSIARTYWGKEHGISILKVLQPMIEAHMAKGRIDLFTGSEVRELLVGDEAVIGVKLSDGRCFHAEKTVLASGGYAANAELFARLHEGASLWSGSFIHSTGRGLEMAEAVGGEIILAETLQPNFGGFLDHTLEPPRYRAPGGLTPQDRQPWEVVVNDRGLRFYKEDNDSVDERTVRLIEQNRSRAWVIYDEHIRRTAPTIFTYFPQSTECFYEEGGAIVSASDLKSLAKICGIDPEQLVMTIDGYNKSVIDGVDSEFNRLHMPCQIAVAPFYALPISAYTVRGYAGVKVDTEFRVLDIKDNAISGLYAVGEVLGSQLSGKGSVGGMALAPALAFGRYLGERIPI